MSEPFLAEIRIFPYNFAPKDWAFCNGQTMPIAQNTALFSLLGTIYGGNGTTNFALPQIQTMCALGMGTGAGLSPYEEGETGGTNLVTLAANQGVSHTHAFKCVNPLGGDSTTNKPDPTMALGRAVAVEPYTVNATAPATMHPKALGPSDPPAGVAAPQPHENRMPYLGLSYCIALKGIFPQRP